MENNLLKMVSQLSGALESKNPELKDLIHIMMNNPLKSDEDILNYIVSKYPEREKEIREGFEGKREEIRKSLDMINKLTSQFSMLKI